MLLGHAVRRALLVPLALPGHTALSRAPRVSHRRAAAAALPLVLRHRGCPLLEHFLLHLLLLRRRHVRVPRRHLELRLFLRIHPAPARAARASLLLLHLLLLLQQRHLLLLLLRLRGFELHRGHFFALPTRRVLRVVQGLLHGLLHLTLLLLLLLLLLHHHVLLLLLRLRVTATGLHRDLLRPHVPPRLLRRRRAANNRRAVAHHHVPAPASARPTRQSHPNRVALHVQRVSLVSAAPGVVRAALTLASSRRLVASRVLRSSVVSPPRMTLAVRIAIQRNVVVNVPRRNRRAAARHGQTVRVRVRARRAVPRPAAFRPRHHDPRHGLQSRLQGSFVAVLLLCVWDFFFGKQGVSVSNVLSMD